MTKPPPSRASSSTPPPASRISFFLEPRPLALDLLASAPSSAFLGRGSGGNLPGGGNGAPVARRIAVISAGVPPAVGGGALSTVGGFEKDGGFELVVAAGCGVGGAAGAGAGAGAAASGAGPAAALALRPSLKADLAVSVASTG